MSKKAVDTIFEAMFTLTDLRVLLRETAPLHDLDASQKEQAAHLILDLQKNIDTLRQELVG